MKTISVRIPCYNEVENAELMANSIVNVFNEALSEYDSDEAIERMTKIFGVVGICPVTVAEELSYDGLKNAAISHFNNNFTDMVNEFFNRKNELITRSGYNFSFKVHTRRINKEFPMNSMEIDMEIGHDLLEEFEDKGLHVDVHNPDIFHEVFFW